LSPLHLAAALLIVAMWGLNFTAIRFGLDEFTPFAFATWRFLLGALPAFFMAAAPPASAAWPGMRMEWPRLLPFGQGSADPPPGPGGGTIDPFKRARAAPSPPP